MNHRKTFLSVLTLLFLLGFVSSCLSPEEFEAKININKNGTYSFVYDGILTYVVIKAAEVNKEKLTANDERKMKEEIEQELLKDPNFKKVNYVGHGRFKVLYKREGTLNSPIYFLNRDISKIISIVPIKEQQVEIRGMKLDKKNIKELQEFGIKVDGQLEVNTNAKVIKHNAKSVPKLFGMMGSYNWQIKSASDPAPYMLLQLQ